MRGRFRRNVAVRRATDEHADHDPEDKTIPARRSATPMMRRVLQAGHFDVPSANGRAQDGQLKTCESVSPMAMPWLRSQRPGKHLGRLGRLGSFESEHG